ncbi:MAG: hypothetical protein GX663_02880 [Clostridiales bacterium]|nr:hypothetical protein [Clostridiales bacterium]
MVFAMEKMIRDYSVYELSKKEKTVVFLGGYFCIFTVSFLFYHNVMVSLISGVLIYYCIPLVKKHLAAKRMLSLNGQFKDMLYSLSASVAAGRQMAEALVEAEDSLSLMYGRQEPIMKELRHMKVNIVENKLSDKQLLMDLAFRSKSEDINNFVQVYVTCRSMGGNLEKIIGHTTEVLTDKMNIEREIKAVTSQKKLEGRIISLMPLVMLLMMNILSASYIAPLYETWGGRLIMTVSLAAMGYGVYLMEKLSNVEV